MALQAVTKHNNVPVTGFGGFDLTIDPMASILTVTLRVYINDRRINPSNSLDSYVNIWRGRVQEFWDDKIEFRSSSGDRLRVRFDLQKSNALGGCHFPVELLDGYAQSSGLKFPSPTSDPFGGRVYLTLMDQDNIEYYIASAPSLLSGNVAVNQRTIALDNLRQQIIGAAPGGQAIFDVPMSKAGNNWNVDLVAQPGLNAFCAALVNTPNWLVAPPIVIHAASGSKTKAGSLTAALMNYIRAQGVTTKIATDIVKNKKRFKAPWTASATTANVRIEVEGISEMYKQWKSDYVVSSHEFGHLIGLPDEYLDYSGMTNATIRNSQPLWDTACTNAGVPLRNWHAQANDSIMSLGTRLYPAHAVIIWSALDALTQEAPNNFPPSDWTVNMI